MLVYIISKLFPKTADKIRQQEADAIFHKMAFGGYLQAEINNDIVVCGLVRVIPKKDARKG